MLTLQDPTAEAKRIMDEAEARKVVLRLLGGVAFFLRCPSAKHRSLQRTYADIDFIGRSKQSKEIKQLFGEIGYVPRVRFNMMQGYKRLIFNDIENKRRADIFLDMFEMSHKFNLSGRLEIDHYTIPLADMLATKLQIAEIEDKDMKDTLSVLTDYDVGDTDSNMINGAYLAKLCSNDWGIYKTFTVNLEKVLATLPGRDLGTGEKEVLKIRIDRLRSMIEDAPKSLKWKMRATIGEKMQWYELPEKDKELVDSRSAAETSVGNA